MKATFFICIFLISFNGLSQQNNLGSWNVINTQVTLSQNWGLFSELQLRSQSFYADHYYYEIKGGASYAVNKNFSFLLGIGKYRTFSDGGSFRQPVTADEFRLWQQLTMNHYLERIKFEHRYRIEQRWFKTGYRNRFRYRLNTAVPLNKAKIEAKTFYLAAFNEVFLTNTAPYFERNRLFAGAGYQFSNIITLQPGWVYQYDYRNNVGSGKHFFQLTLIIDLDTDKSSFEKIPGNLD